MPTSSVTFMPQVSILLPVYAAEHTLQRAIDSIQAQTLTDWELLAIDDGSTDQSSAILRQAALEDSRIRVSRTATNRGIVDALTEAIAQARAPLLARMDADDEMHPERLQRQLNYLQAHPEIGVVSCGVQHGGDAFAQKGYAAYIDWLNTLQTPEEIRNSRFVESPLAHPSVLFRAELIARHGGYRNGHFPEDYELWLRWLEAGVQMAKVPEMLLTWHDLPQRLSRTDERYHPDAFHGIKAGYLAREIERIRNGRQLWLCGTGRITRRRSAFLLAEGITATGYVDVNPKKIGTLSGTLPVISIHQLPDADAALVVSYITNRGAREAIQQLLSQRNFCEGTDFILAG